MEPHPPNEASAKPFMAVEASSTAALGQSYHRCIILYVQICVVAHCAWGLVDVPSVGMGDNSCLRFHGAREHSYGSHTRSTTGQPRTTSQTPHPSRRSAVRAERRGSNEWLERNEVECRGGLPHCECFETQRSAATAPLRKACWVPGGQASALGIAVQRCQDGSWRSSTNPLSFLDF